MARRVHRDVARLFIVGVFAVAVGVVIAVVGSRVQNGGSLPLKRYTNVTGTFEEVGTLKVAQKVAENGIRIGVVSRIMHEDGKAVVTLRLDGHHDVYKDATLQLGNESAVGRKYIVLDPGTPAAGPLPKTGVPISQTKAPADLSDVLAVFNDQARAGLRTGVRELGGGAIGHGADLHATLSVSDQLVNGLDALTKTLSSREADLPALLRTTHSLAGHLQSRSVELRSLLRESSTTLEALNIDKGTPLRVTVRDLPMTLVQARADLAKLNPVLADVATATEALGSGGRALGAATPDLRAFLRQSVQPLEKVPGVSTGALPALKSLTTTFDDARPLAPRLRSVLAIANPLLTVLAPYAEDAGRVFSQHDMLSGRFSPTEHYFSAMLAFPGVYNVSTWDPLADVDPYPGPGQAWGPTRNGGSQP